MPCLYPVCSMPVCSAPSPQEVQTDKGNTVAAGKYRNIVRYLLDIELEKQNKVNSTLQEILLKKAAEQELMKQRFEFEHRKSLVIASLATIFSEI